MYDALPHSGSTKREKGIKPKEDFELVLESARGMGTLNEELIKRQIASLKAMDGYEEICSHIFSVLHILSGQAKKLVDTRIQLENFSLTKSNKDRKAQAEKAIEDLRELDDKTEKRIIFFTAAATKFVEKKYKSKALESSRNFLDYVEDAMINIEKYTDEPINDEEMTLQKGEEKLDITTEATLPEPLPEKEITGLGVLTVPPQAEEPAPETVEADPVVQQTEVLNIVEDVPPISKPPAVISEVNSILSPVPEKTEARKVETGELGELIRDMMSDGKKRITYYDADNNEYSPEEIVGSIISEKMKLEELKDERNQAREIEIFIGTLPKLIKPKSIIKRVEAVLVDYVKLLNINKKTMREGAPQQSTEKKIPDDYFSDVKNLEELRTKMWELEGADKSRKQWIEDTVAGAVKEIRKPETTTYRRLEILNELKKKNNLPNIGGFKDTLLKLLEEEVSKIAPKENPIKTEIPDTYFAGAKSVPELITRLASKVSSEDFQSVEKLALNALALMRTARALKEKDSLIEKIIKDKDFPSQGSFRETLKEILKKELDNWEKRSASENKGKKKEKTPVSKEIGKDNDEDVDLVEGDELPRAATTTSKEETVSAITAKETKKPIKEISEFIKQFDGLTKVKNLDELYTFLRSVNGEFKTKDSSGLEIKLRPEDVISRIERVIGNFDLWTDTSTDAFISGNLDLIGGLKTEINNSGIPAVGKVKEKVLELLVEKYSKFLEAKKADRGSSAPVGPIKPKPKTGEVEAKTQENTPIKETSIKKKLTENYFENAKIKTIGDVVDLLRGELKNNTFTTEDFKIKYTADGLLNKLIEEGVKLSQMIIDGTTTEDTANEINRFQHELPTNGGLDKVLGRVLMDNYFDPFVKPEKSASVNEEVVINSVNSLSELKEVVQSLDYVHTTSGIASEGVAVADSIKNIIWHLRTRSFKDYKMGNFGQINAHQIEISIAGMFPTLPQFPTLEKKIIDLAVAEYNHDVRVEKDIKKIPNFDMLVSYLKGAYKGEKIKGSRKEYTVEEIVNHIQEIRGDVLSLDSEGRKLLIEQPNYIILATLTDGGIGLVNKVRELLVSELSAFEKADSSPSALVKSQSISAPVPTPIDITTLKPIVEGKTRFELNGYNKDTIDIPEFRAFITEFPNVGEIVKDEAQLKQKYEIFVKRREVSEEIQKKLGDIVKKEFGLDFGKEAGLLADEYLRTLSREKPEEIARYYKSILDYRAAPAKIEGLKREIIPVGTNARRREELPKEIAERELLVKNLKDYKKSLDRQPFFKLFDVINPAFRSKDSRLEKIKGVTLGEIERTSREEMEKNTKATASSTDRYNTWKEEVFKRVDYIIKNVDEETEALRVDLDNLNTKSAKQIIQEKEDLVSEMMRDVYSAPLQSELLKSLLQEKAKSEMEKLMGGKGNTVKAADLLAKFKGEIGQSIYGFNEDQVDVWTRNVDIQAIKEMEEKMTQKIESLGGHEKFDAFVSAISDLLAEKEIGTQKDKNEVKKFLVDKIKETIDSAPAGIRKGLLEKALKTALEIKK